MIKPAFCTGLRDFLWRLDVRMESPTHQNNPHVYRMSLHLCTVSTLCENVGSYFQL